MIQQENHFQYLVALAVAGQISDDELEELAKHTAGCSSCSQRMAEMESTNFQLFLSLATQIKKPRISSRMQERFLIRAEHSGLRTTIPASGFLYSNLLHLAALLVAVCLLSGLGWKRIMLSSSRRSRDSATQVKIGPPAQLSALAGSGPVLLETPAARCSINGPTHCSRHADRKASRLPSFGMDEESRIAAQPLFRLNIALFPDQSATVNTVAKLSHLTDVAAGNFSPRSVGLEPSFSSPVIWSSKASSIPDQHVFHYSSTLASVSLQDHQAVFGLKPRMRDLSFSNMPDSTHLR